MNIKTKILKSQINSIINDKDKKLIDRAADLADIGSEYGIGSAVEALSSLAQDIINKNIVICPNCKKETIVYIDIIFDKEIECSNCKYVGGIDDFTFRNKK